MPTPELAPFFKALRGTGAKQASSRLLNTADRDLGAILSRAQPDEVEEVLSFLGEAKRARLEAEMLRMRRVRLSLDNIAFIAAHLARHVEGERPLGPATRYFKPHRPGGD